VAEASRSVGPDAAGYLGRIRRWAYRDFHARPRWRPAAASRPLRRQV